MGGRKEPARARSDQHGGRVEEGSERAGPRINQ